MEKINIPRSMCKKMLSQNGLRVTPESTKKFETLFRLWAAEVSKKATEAAKAQNRKTIFPEDLEGIVIEEDSTGEEEEED